MLSGPAFRAPPTKRPIRRIFKPRDKELLAKVFLREDPRFRRPSRRAIVDYHRKESAGLDRGRFSRQPTTFIWFRANGKAIRYVRHHPSAEEAMGHGPALPRSAARPSGRRGIRRPGEISRLRRAEVRRTPDRIIRWVSRALYLYFGRQGHAVSVFTAPTSRNISAHRFRRAASA